MLIFCSFTTTIASDFFIKNPDGQFFVSPLELAKNLFRKIDARKEQRDRFASLVTEHSSFIDELCAQLVARNRSAHHMAGLDGFSLLTTPDRTDQENEKDELFVAVIDHLTSDDFKVLRKFKHESKFSTYLTSVVSRLEIDIVRHKRGRSRAKERAAKMGDVAAKLYDLVYGKKYTSVEAQGCLEASFGIRVGIEHVNELLEQMHGRVKEGSFPHDGPTGFLAISSAEAEADGVELVIPELEKTPEKLVAKRQRSDLAGRVISEFQGSLSGQDKLIFRMRFPMNEEEEPMTCREIGQFVDMSEDKVQRTIDKILKNYRERLISKGISLDDLI